MKCLHLLSLCLFLISCSKRELEVGAPRVDNVRMNHLLSSLPPPGQEPLVGYAGVNGTTTGGAGGPTVTVDNLTDLINYAKEPGALVIQVVGTIIGSGNDRIVVKPNKTITGLTGATLRGVGISIWGVENVIIRNLCIEYVRTMSNVIIKGGAHHVWIDHCNLRNETNRQLDYYDGLLDIGGTEDAVTNYITVSWCKFSDADQASLLGSATKPTDLAANLTTFHHNLYEGVIERTPKVCQSHAHVFNNYYKDSHRGFAIGATFGGLVLAENNYFDNFTAILMTTHYDYPNEPMGYIIDSNNYACSTCGPKYVLTSPPSYTPPYAYTLSPVMDVPALVMARAGTYSTAITGPIYQFEEGLLTGGATSNIAYSGFYGTGYVELPLTGGSVQINNIDGQGGGLKKLTLRYSLAGPKRIAQLILNGGVPISVSVLSTGSWSTWDTISAAFILNNSHNNTIKITSNGEGWGLLDELTLSAAQVDPPLFASHPDSITVNAGNDVTLSASVTGTPPLTYQWERNGVNIPGANLSSLTIPNASSVDAGTYRLMATNTAGSVTSAPATLSVITPPADIYQFENGTLTGGAAIESAQTGYHGTGYVILPSSGGSVKISNIDGRYTGTKVLKLRYSLADTVRRKAHLIINGALPVSLALDPTGAWNSWNSYSAVLALPNNLSNTIKIETTGEGFGYIDEITVE